MLAADAGVGKRHGWMLLAIAFALVVALCGVDFDNAAARPGHDDCSIQAATGASSPPAPPVPYPVALVVSVGLPVLPLRASEHHDVAAGPLEDRLRTFSASPRSPPLG